MATVPVWPSLPVLHKMTAADMASIKTYIDFTQFSLGGLFLAYQTVAQSIPINTVTELSFTTEVVDIDNGHSTITNITRYTAQTPGQYEVAGAYQSIAPASATDLSALIQKNSTTTIAFSRLPKTSGLGSYMPVGPILVSLNAGDWVTVCANQGSTAAVLTDVSSTGSSLYVKYVRPQ